MALDEATAILVAQIAASSLKPPMEMSVEERRASYAARNEMSGQGPRMARVEDVWLPTPDGSRFAVRALVPAGPIGAVVVYYHGGGWVLGSVDEFETLGRTIAAELSAAVVLTDYRLAPEHRFPAAADDAWLALQWAARHCDALAGGSVPLLVMGDSAGGNLSAVVARRARDAGGPRLAAQVLIYPVTDADMDNATYLDPENQLLLTRELMAWYWDHYVPDHAHRLDPDASPLRTADLSGLPPAIILTAEHDVLRQEGEQYAERLQQAGVPVQLRRFPGQMHGFFAMVNVLPGSTAGLAYIADQLAELLP